MYASQNRCLQLIPCVWSRYRIKESSGWQQVFSSPYLDWTIERIALNAKVVGGPHGDKDKMVAAASESSIILWSIQDGGSGNEIGKQRITYRGPYWTYWILRIVNMLRLKKIQRLKVLKRKYNFTSVGTLKMVCYHAGFKHLSLEMLNCFCTCWPPRWFVTPLTSCNVCDSAFTL